MSRRAAVALAAGAVGIAGAWLVGASLAFPVRVASASMEPYAARGDFGVAVHARDVRRGDVVVFHYPFGTPGLAIKRAAILAGECMPPPGAGPGRRPEPGRAGGCGLRGRRRRRGVRPGRQQPGVDRQRSFGPVPAGEIVGKVVLMLPVGRWLAEAGDGFQGRLRARRKRERSRPAWGCAESAWAPKASTVETPPPLVGRVGA